MKNILALSILITLLTSLGCSSCKKNITGGNGLPPATQNGSKTLGFLLNGQPWTPQGFDGTSNLSLYYDPPYRGGVFNIYCYNRLHNSNIWQILTIAADSVQQTGRLTFGMKNFVVVYEDMNNPLCQYDSSDSINIVTPSGYCDITKLDRINHILSGQFSFTLIRSGCDTIKITEGGFDMPY